MSEQDFDMALQASRRRDGHRRVPRSKSDKIQRRSSRGEDSGLIKQRKKRPARRCTSLASAQMADRVLQERENASHDVHNQAFALHRMQNLFAGDSAATHDESTPYQHHKFHEELKEMRVKNRDLLMLASNDQAFRAVKQSLKGMGCVTNGYLQQSLHFYLQHTKEVNQRLAARRHPQRNSSNNAMAA